MVGEGGIPERWLRRVSEDVTPAKMREIAFGLYQKGKIRNFKA
jgi:hypothetical protein